MLMRRVAGVALAVALVIAGCAGAKPAPGKSEGFGEARALVEQFVRSYYARYPEWATFMAFPGADHAAVTDVRPEAFDAWRAEEDRFLAKARAIPLATAERRDVAALASVIELLEASVAMRVCRPELWGVTTLGSTPTAFATSGWTATLAQLAEVQPVGTPALRDAWVKRISARSAMVDAEIDNLRRGMRSGFVSSRPNVERVIIELDALLATPAAEWPTCAPAGRDDTPGFREELARATGAVVSATRRYRDFLANEYLAAARQEPGVFALPRGEVCYRAAIREFTTLQRSPDELHALGLAELHRIRNEMRVIAERGFGTKDVGGLLARFRDAPEFRYRSSDEVLERAAAAVARARAAVLRLLPYEPTAQVQVRAYPEAQARAGAAAMYVGAGDGDQYEGVYLINVASPNERSRIGDESLAFHEAIPGHHLQQAVVAASGQNGSQSRYLFSNAYAEGWALYSERVADEVGLFSSDEERLGMLSYQAFRAARLVVDTGLHAKGWTREQAAAFLADATGKRADEYLFEVDRYCAWPGQALGYMTGALEIRALRAEAERRLGARFDVRAFHEIVLRDGNVPLGVLADNVRSWIASQEASPPRVPVPPAP